MFTKNSTLNSTYVAMWQNVTIGLGLQIMQKTGRTMSFNTTLLTGFKNDVSSGLLLFTTATILNALNAATYVPKNMV